MKPFFKFRFIFFYAILFLLILSSCSEEEYDTCDFDKDGSVQTIEQKKCDQPNAAVPIKPNREDDTTNAETDDASERETSEVNEVIDERDEVTDEANGVYVAPSLAFISIHMEPGKIPTTTEWPEDYWDDLITLVALADDYNVKLTLNFNPQWGTYILADDERLALLREWEANGHEIALHHHGPHHGTWNGYTNQEEYFDDRKYIGSVEDMMEIMNQLPASGQILTAGIGGEEDVDPDWPDAVLYETDGGAEGIDDLLSIPTVHYYNGHTVVGLRHAGYTTATKVSLAEMMEVFETAQEGEIVGIVFHEHNYAEQPDTIEKLFQFLEEQHIEVKTAQDILNE